MNKSVLVGLANGDGFDAVSDQFDMVVIEVGRNEVERGAIGDVIDRLLKLSDTRENTLRFASSVLFVFDGYNKDSRELVDIPEVVRFFRQVHSAWPYWLHFLVKEPSQFQFLFSMLLDLAPPIEVDGQRIRPLVGVDRLQPFLLDLFGPMNHLYMLHGIGMKENEAMTKEVIGVVQRLIG